MDNLTHTLCGAALAKTRLGSRSRLASWSLIVGANLPDLDIVSRLFAGKAAYLVHHRGITHSLLGVAVGALLLAALVRWIEGRTWGSDATRAWPDFLLPAFVGLLSHPALDWLNNYGVRPWLPFSSARYFGDLVFIVDPLLWLIFGSVAALAGRRTPAGQFAWAAVAIGSAWLVVTSTRAPDDLKKWWPAALALVALLRGLGVGARSPRRILIGGAAALALYIGGLEVSSRLAVRRHAAHDVAMVSPVLCDPFSWWVWTETPTAYHLWWARASGDWISDEVIERRLDDPRVIAAAKLPQAAAWRYFARLPMARVVDHPDGGCTVTLSDARYHFAQGPYWCSIEIELPPGAAPTER